MLTQSKDYNPDLGPLCCALHDAGPSVLARAVALLVARTKIDPRVAHHILRGLLASVERGRCAMNALPFRQTHPDTSDLDSDAIVSLFDSWIVTERPSVERAHVEVDSLYLRLIELMERRLTVNKGGEPWA